MAEEFDPTPWEQAEGFLQNLSGEGFTTLSLEVARCGRINETVDGLILRLVKSNLMAANTKTEFIRVQAMVASLLQLRAHILASIAPGGNA